MRYLVMLLLLLLAVVGSSRANYPLFDESTKMRVLLVPADTRVGTPIYRLRATDSDYDFPLAFEVLGRAGKSVVRVEAFPCARNHSACEANVVLARALQPDRIYHFRLSVRDARGDSTNVEASLRATNSSSVASLDRAFPHYSTLVMVPENAKPGTELDYIMVRKSNLHSRHAYMELTGSPLFTMKQRLSGPDVSNGTIILNGELDFEKQNLYPMLLYATDPYVLTGVDTRNILGFDLAIVVIDVQDTPPVFVMAPPVTPLPPRAQPGDLILRVHAEDGDRGRPRDIRYGLLSEGNPFTPFFSIDENSGEVRLTRSLADLRAISRPGQPVMLRVLAEEVISVSDVSGELEARQVDSTSAVAELALLLPGSANTPPYFEAESYVATIPEGSPAGTPIIFTDPWMPRVRDNDMGLGAVFALSLEGDNGTFEVSPAVVEGSANFVVRVKNSAALDYEKFHSLAFKVIAREVSQAGAAALSASTSVTVLLTDVNDNPPRFQQPSYMARLPENVTAGTLVAQVHADDVDTGPLGRVSYTRILGSMNSSLSLDPETGQVTVATNNHGFDREDAPEYRLYVEARDEAGEGLATTVPLTITLIDVNDHAPAFEHTDYELFLGPENRNFTTKIFLKAMDMDAESPNNEVRYEISSGNIGEKFRLDEITGELTVRPDMMEKKSERDTELERKEPTSYLLSVRAYDLGVPHRWSRAEVKIHSAGSDKPTAGPVVFIVPRSPADVREDPRRTERLLAQLTGGRVAIREVRPYRPGDPELVAADLAPGAADGDKSVVVALLSYSGEPAVVDVAQVQQRLMANQSATTITREVVTEYRAESSALFWFLVFLALMLAVAILALVVCFFHSGCPLYFGRKDRRDPRSPEEVRLVLERASRDTGDKRIELRREAWSADGARRYLQFNRRNILTLDHRPVLEQSRTHVVGATDSQADGAASQPGGGLNVIYTREMQQQQGQQTQPPHRKRDVTIEDVESDSRQNAFNPRDSTRSLPALLPINSNLVCIKDREGNRILVHQDESADEIDSMRRHELERGSDVGQVRYVMRERSAEPEVVEVLTLDEEEANGREQHYLKAGNAEVLRLLTRGKADDKTYRPRRVHQTDAGKDIIMRRFMQDALLPGQLQTGTQTDEERGTQTENESVNTPPHAVHVIKTPILEENESMIEQHLASTSRGAHMGPHGVLNMGHGVLMGPHGVILGPHGQHMGPHGALGSHGVPHGLLHGPHMGHGMPEETEEQPSALEKRFAQVVEAAYERGKSETEFNFGDTKSSLLRRILNNEKAIMEGPAADEKDKRIEKDSHVSRGKEHKSGSTHRSQSLPRSVHDAKKRSSVKENVLQKKSTSINSGLDKASRVTFASPEQSMSDDEILHGTTVRKKSTAGGSSSNLRSSNSSINKSATSTRRHKSRERSFSDDERSPAGRSSVRRATSSLSLHKSSTSSKHRASRKISLSDDEEPKPRLDTRRSSSNLGLTRRGSNASIKSSNYSRVRKSRDEGSDDEGKDSSLRRKSSSTNLRVPGSRYSASPGSSTRKGSIRDEEDEEVVEKSSKSKLKVPSRRSSIPASPAGKSRVKSRQDQESDEEVKVHKSKSSSSHGGASTSKSKSSTRKQKETESDEEQKKSTSSSRSKNASTALRSKVQDQEMEKSNGSSKKQMSSVGKNKEKLSPGEETQSFKEKSDSELESEGEELSEEPTTQITTAPKNGKKKNPDKNDRYQNNNEDGDTSPTNQSQESLNGNNNNSHHKNSSVRKNSSENNSEKKRKNSTSKSNSNNNKNSDVSKNEINLLRTGQGSDKVRPISRQQDTAMQTHVSLVPLINSMGLGPGGIDDDLDSGIAMSQTADGKSRRLNQLIEKKSIFTIAYDDMQINQLRADSASPQFQ